MALTNAEPVAWINAHYLRALKDEWVVSAKLFINQDGPNDVALYTNPAPSAMDAGKLSKEDQLVALIKAWRSTIHTGSPVAEMLDALHANGFEIRKKA